MKKYLPAILIILSACVVGLLFAKYTDATFLKFEDSVIEGEIDPNATPSSGTDSSSTSQP